MRHLFVLDPLQRINPAKDSTAALMQAAARAGHELWACTPADLIAMGDAPIAMAAMVQPEPWLEVGALERLPLEGFSVIWMRKDPPVDEAYLYATHLLEVAERAGVRVLNRPSSLRAWNEKLGALRFSRWMAPTLVAGRVAELTAFAQEQGDIVLKPLGGRAGLGVIRVAADAPGLGALLELVTEQERLPVMAQRFLPQVSDGDKRILLVDGEPLGAVNRRPKQGEFRSNLAVGGHPEATELSERERHICAALAPSLRAEGLFFVGIDVIGGMLSEINVTSPTGIREVERLMDQPLADQVIERLQAQVVSGTD
ncbi:Glutathione synthetase [Synechococcus sp. WH 8101]|uniref:glutathione synthase n=1 Tax=Synechococcus sp. WH 8101 TaxID=59932 RepID=UPI001022A7EA|nr:glutathione synthase [Synechococcus sp. WH 8101]QBE70214.1 Glutathione synthetase [Synechococcus sp. WH 8101]QNI46486.1 glutathione synthetase [Synechococcus sp. WH 8101]